MNRPCETESDEMIQFEGSINSQSVLEALGNFEASLGDFSGAFGSISDDFGGMVREQFATQGEAGGTPWAGLAPATLRRKKGGGGILDGTGALLDSLADPQSPDHVASRDKLSLTLGTDLPYAMFQQTGAGWGLGQTSLPPGPRHGHGVPMRPLPVLTSDYRDRWVGFVLQQIQANVRTLGAPELGGVAQG